jgi:WD40 repeat protein/GTPase SAR1 family protein
MSSIENLPGIELRYELPGQDASSITSVAWSPDGRLLAAVDQSKRIVVWAPAEGRKVFSSTKAKGVRAAWHPDGKVLVVGGDQYIQRWNAEDWSPIGLPVEMSMTSLAWSPDGSVLAIGGPDNTITFFKPDFSRYKMTVNVVNSTLRRYQISWHPDGRMLASGSADHTVGLWAWPQVEQIGHHGAHSGEVNGVVWSPDGLSLVSASDDRTLRVWNPQDPGQPPRILEGHTSSVFAVALSPCGRLLASRGQGDGIRLWRTDTWAPLVQVPEEPTSWTGGIAFHPASALLATASGGNVRVWAFEPDRILGEPAATAVLYTTAKVVLVGESGVGKTGLGWRLAHGQFREHASTHGQQFWMLDSLRATRADGTECEAVLWDLAGQPDYRLLHALFLDDAELALVLFDPTDRAEPLQGADYWLKALARRPSGPCPAILVGARIDRGQPTLTEDQILAFCADRGVSGGYLPTSAFTGEGLTDLVMRMQAQVEWDQIPTTVTTTTFKRIKEFTLSLKERERIIVSPQELRQRLEGSDPDWEFTDDELTTAVGHLAKHGYVQLLRTAAGQWRILLRPDLLNRLASSMVLEARRNPKGLGALDEAVLRGGGYRFSELDGMSAGEQDILLDAAAVLFLEHNLCFREWVGSQALLIFPELINRKRPPGDGQAMADDVSYTIQGAVANVYAALVVLLGYTNTFTRTEQWRAQAQYEVGNGEICGFRQIAEREGEIDLVLSYGPNTSVPTRLIFQGLFERILLGRSVTVTRYPPLDCAQCHYRQERSEVVRRTLAGSGFLFCSNCGTKTAIPQAKDLGLSAATTSTIDEQAATAARRTAYETALAQVSGFVRTWEHEPKRLFISYAWGVTEHERWVEQHLARDLRLAGIDIVLDRWNNAQPGANIARFVSRISECDLIVVVGTPLYRGKYENKLSATGSVVAAEVDLINQRLLGTEEQKRTVLPVLLDSDAQVSLPPLLGGRVYVDFRPQDAYFASLFDLILAIQGVPFDDNAVIDLRQSLRDDSGGKAWAAGVTLADMRGTGGAGGSR